MGRLTEIIEYLNCEPENFSKLMRKDKGSYINFSHFDPKPSYIKYRAQIRKDSK